MPKRNAIILGILLTTASCLPPDRIGRHPAGFDPAPKLAFEPIPDVAIGMQVASADGAGWPLPMAGAAAILLPHTGEDARRALECLTAAVYYEARSEPLVGQRAVAQVVLNRVRDPAFPKSVCGVVYQGTGADRRAGQGRGCQFQFACDGSLLMRRDPIAWDRSRVVARAALRGLADAPVGGATYYHTDRVSPYWAPGLTRVATIGAHIFYGVGAAWRGMLGTGRYTGIEPAMERAAIAEAVDARLVATAPRGPVAEAAVTIHRGDGFAGVAVHRGGVMPAALTTTSEMSVVTDAVADAGVQVHRGMPAPVETAAVSLQPAEARPAN